MVAALSDLRLIIPYKIFPDNLGGEVYSAMLNVSMGLPLSVSSGVPGSLRTKRFEAIIDSGASRCMFHADLARFLGIDLHSGRRETTQGIGGAADAWVHEIALYLPGGAVTVQASFKEDLPIAGLLGMNGFFEHFIVTFIHFARHCTIERIEAGHA